MSRYRDPLTKDLFSWEPPQIGLGYGAEVTGRGALDNRIARLIGHALREAREDGLGRAEVARRMTVFLGRPISEAMLNKWSSEGSEDHRIPLDAFIGLVHATGAKDLLGFAPAEFGLAVIEAQHADLIEARLLEDHIRDMQARQQVLETKLRGRR